MIPIHQHMNTHAYYIYIIHYAKTEPFRKRNQFKLRWCSDKKKRTLPQRTKTHPHNQKLSTEPSIQQNLGTSQNHIVNR
jgi:hypothetical protein